MAREMKDSGVEWIGEIPEDWGIRRIKYVAEFEPKCNMSELNNDCIVTYLPMECLKNGYFERREHNLEDLSTSLTRFQENDIVMAKVTPCFENGNIAIMQKLKSGFGVGSSELFVFRCKKVNVHYLFWWLQNKGFVSQACSTMVGTGGLKRISPYFIKNCAMHMPPEIEQIRISNFLYVQCAKLDNVLEKTRASIEEYKKLKQAVITQAVTKGIRGDREMKNSGIEWIGEIPAEWNLIKVTRLLDYSHLYPIGDGDHGLIKTDDYIDAGVPYIRVQNLGWGTELDCDNIVYISEERNQVIANSILKPNDILFAKTGATIGKTAIVPSSIPVSNTTSHIGKITVSSDYIPRFVFYVMSSYLVYRQFWEIAGLKSTRPELSIDEIKKIKLIIPSGVEEQQEIVSYLDKKCSAIDDLIVKKEQYLSEIENYKKSLIYEYVTGKKEVPQEYRM